MKIRLNYSIYIYFKIKIYENLIQNMESIQNTIYFLRDGTRISHGFFEQYQRIR